MITSSGQSKRLLIVDDDPAERHRVSAILAKEGFDVCSCENSQEAIGKRQERQFDIAIVDLGVGTDDGIRLIEKLTRVHPAIRCIAHSAFRSFDSAKDAVNAGAFAFVEKVGNPGELVRQVYRAAQDPMDDALLQGEQRHRAVVEASQTELRIRNRAIDAAKCGIVITDATKPDHPIIYCNSAFESLTGYSKAETLGRNCRFLQAGDQNQPGVQELRVAVAEERDGTTILRNYRKNGLMFWNKVSISPVHDDSGRVTHFVGFQNDVTERVESERKLRDSEHKFRIIFEQAAVGVGLVEAKTGRLEKVNGKYADLVGYSQDELMQMTFMDITHPEDLDDDWNNIRQLQAGKIPDFTMEKRLIRKDGTPVWINLTVAPFWRSGREAVHLVAIVEDISARKSAESQLLARSRQQAALATLGLTALQRSEINELFDEAVVVLAVTLNADFTIVLQLSESGDALQLLAGVGWTEGLIGSGTVPADVNSQAGYTLAQNQSVIVANLASEARFTGAPLLLDHGVVSGVSVVIHGPDRPFGVLGVHTNHERIFSQHEVNFVQSVANVLTNAIQRSKTEGKLRASEQSLTDAQEIANIGSWQYDWKTGEITGSTVFYRILGITSEKLGIISEKIVHGFESLLDQLTHPDDRELVRS
ncbi:MAG: PAS domain S-box protein, partial [Pirellulales bacterium]